MPLCPAGCIISSASDMANWMTMHLNGGNFSGNPIVSGMHLSSFDLEISEKSLSVTYAPSNAIGQYAVFTKPTFPVGVTLGT